MWPLLVTVLVASVYLTDVNAARILGVYPIKSSYLDSSTHGAVYVSLGTSVRPSQMNNDLLVAFLDAFETLPSGGLQSTDEAIDAEGPLVGIPMLADQWYNTNKYVKLGIGIDVDSYTMVADDLVKAVNTVVNDPSYKENIKKLKAFMQDQPEKAIERAVWWTKHVLRHRGSRYLRGAGAKVSWCEYLMLDVLITLAIVLFILLFVSAVAITKIIKLVLRKNTKVKVKRQ